MTTKLSRGFTLIELLVVIAIVSLLSSIVYANLALARTKSIDARKKADIATVRTAMATFHLDNQRMPNNYTCTSGTCVVNNNRATLAMQDTANPENPQTEAGKAYQASMMELVAGGYLPAVPLTPGGAGYVYYNYGSGSAAGAMFGTSLSSGAPSTTGEPGSCRPFGGPNVENDPAPYDPNNELEGEVTNWPTPTDGEEVNPQNVCNPKLGNCDGGTVWNCTYVDEETGTTYEAPCPDETDGGNNICSTGNNRDFCMCVTF